MALTDGLKLPIPELTEAADGPDAFSDLGNAIEDYLYDRILPTGVTRWPHHHWGSGNSFPTAADGAKVGDTYTHTGLGSALMVFMGGTAWRQVDPPVRVASATARTAISTALTPPTGFLVQEVDTGRVLRWEGSLWRKISGSRSLIVGNAGGAASGTLAVGSYAIASSIAIPAHTAGELDISFTGSWWASAGNAAYSRLMIGPASGATIANSTLLPGSDERGHNEGTVGPVKITCRAPYESDGTARTAILAVLPEAAALIVDMTNWHIFG